MSMLICNASTDYLLSHNYNFGASERNGLAIFVSLHQVCELKK